MAHRRQHSGFGNVNIINGVNPGLMTKHSADIDELTKKSQTHSILRPRSYFTDLTTKKAIMYTIASLYVIGCGLASMVEPFLELPCFVPEGEKSIAYPNPNYDGSRCPNVRYRKLLFMNRTECSFGRRLVMSIIMGGLIGWERRQADRPAGIRTMSLVSLGSCLFTINSAFAFVSGPEDWDASRISAAIPSGVGFLGAGLIFKKTNDDDNMVVHGLTTAASVWLSAAVRAFLVLVGLCVSRIFDALCSDIDIGMYIYIGMDGRMYESINQSLTISLSLMYVCRIYLYILS